MSLTKRNLIATLIAIPVAVVASAPGFIMLAGLIGSSGSQDQLAASTPSAHVQVAEAKEQPAAAPKTWQTVATLSGDNKKRGELFNLTGEQSRLTYTVSGDYPSIYVYLMDKGTSLNEDGGISEVSGATTSGETLLYKKPGTYYLDVSGYGSWSVVIEELR